MEKLGKVWLAGAGPGDMGLLTLKTRALLEAADVIVYDALISAEILSLIPAETQKVNVGKRAGNHLVPQEEINRLLLEHAKAGKKVLRLKGGDPFVFGRGGEELELLEQEEIPFEIIPGITSASAVPAYAGIPVTHRDYTSSFHVITGHPKKDGSLCINYETLVKLDATLVFLMGISSMDKICEGLMEAGMEPQMPAAILEKGTTARQRSVISTIGHLSQDAKDKQIGTPAIILVGKVCTLARKFSWAEKRPLGGKQILLTRPRQRSGVLAGKLRELGAQVIELPSIMTVPITDNSALRNALERVGRKREEWLVFTSPAGVDIFFEQIEAMQYDLRRILGGSSEVKFAVIGSATKCSLQNRGLIADLMPQEYNAWRLGRLLAKCAKPDSHITILRAEAGSEFLLKELAKENLNISDISIYRTQYQADDNLKEKITEMFLKKEIDAVTFTSASTVQGFIRTMDKLDYTMVKAVCIGEQTKAEADKYKMQTYTAKEASMDGMTELICELLQK